MTAMDLHHCPGPETLASFVEGSLPRAEVATVVRHLQGCADCRDIVGDVVEFQREDPDTETAEPAPLRPRRWWIPAAAAAALVLVTSTIFVVQQRRDPLQELIEAATAATRRPLVARLAGLPHREFRDPRKSPALPTEDLHFDGPASRVIARSGTSRSSRDLHATGIAYLVTGDAATAVNKLSKAAEQEPQNDAILNDLAAARIEAGDYRGALAAAEQALSANPRSTAAQFNRAIVLEKLNETDEAKRAWSHYLEMDGQSSWADEARTHLRELGR